MATFTLNPATPVAEVPAPSRGNVGLGGELLLLDAHWFTRIRWSVVAVLVLIGAAGRVLPSSFVSRMGLVPPGYWPFALAAGLTLLNIFSLFWLHRLPKGVADSTIRANLWFQIVSDLCVLTLLVCFTGPTDTPVAFAFLFHIVLSCIFLGRRDSLFVTLLSTGLFTSTVALVEYGIVPRRTVLVSGVDSTAPAVVTVLFSVFVWFVVWFLASTISGQVRQRDFELARANARLREADADKNRQMLRVTHDLKAPFSGIESSIQVMRHVHWESIPDPVRQIVEKIEKRSGTLRARIGEILTLGSLRSGQVSSKTEEPTSLRDLIGGVVEELRGLAAQKDVTILCAAGDVSVYSDPRQLKILFMNLISNAISYSHDADSVDISLWRDNEACVEIADHGIGIDPDALPRIFDDFYRSKEAATFNPKSTGLGLAAVRQVAENLGLTIEVESQPAEGTTFRIRIPLRSTAGETAPA